MPHIHTKDGQYDHTVDMLVFRMDLEEPKILLHFHRKLHSYMQFGGHIELDEHPLQTLTHELKEEAGYDLSQMKILQPKGSLTNLSGAILHPVPVIYNTHQVTGEHFHTSVAYALTTEEEPASPPREGESTDIRLFTREEIVNLSDDKIKDNIREGILYVFDQILSTWEEVDLLVYES